MHFLLKLAYFHPIFTQDGICHHNDTTRKVEVESYVNVTGGEEALKVALFKQGAVSVAIDASHKSLSFYESGVYYDPACSKCTSILPLPHPCLPLLSAYPSRLFIQINV